MFSRTVDSNTRRVPRRSIAGVRGTLRSPGDVRVVDVSVFGLAIEAPAELQVGERYFLELRHGRHVANVEVTVRWAYPAPADDGEALARAGVEFTEIYRETRGGIWDWLRVSERERDATN